MPAVLPNPINIGSSSTAASTAVVNITPGAQVPGGTAIIVNGSSDTTNDVTSVTDDAGNKYIKIAGSTSGMHNSLWICRCCNALNTSDQIHVNYASTGTDHKAAGALRQDGVFWMGSPIDQEVAANGTGTTLSLTIPQLLQMQERSFLLATVANAGGTPSVPSGWTSFRLQAPTGGAIDRLFWNDSTGTTGFTPSSTILSAAWSFLGFTLFTAPPLALPPTVPQFAQFAGYQPGQSDFTTWWYLNRQFFEQNVVFRGRQAITAQSIPSGGADTVIQLDTIDEDTQSGWSAGSSSWSPAITGWYDISAEAFLQTVAAGNDVRAGIKSAAVPGGSGQLAVGTCPGSASHATGASGRATLFLVAGEDTVKLTIGLLNASVAVNTSVGTFGQQPALDIAWSLLN